MIHQSPNINAFWSALIIEELVRNGVDQFCISPGSRSTPLTLAAAENKYAKTRIFYDERAAAFFAIGHAKATHSPAVLICTSGTAVANYFPAIVEAASNNLPMIILTADRPPELRNTGANQTIEQAGIFGRYTRWQFDLPCPTENITAKFVLTTVDSAVHHARRSPAGPVHLNCMFREPLAPVPDAKSRDINLSTLENWLNAAKPFTRYQMAAPTLTEAQAKLAATVINAASSGLVILGEMRQHADRQAALEFCRELNWPVFADVQSGLRLKNWAEPFLPFFDQLLLSEALPAEFCPETIIQFGDRIVSKRLLQFIEKQQPEHYLLVADHPFRHDALHGVTMRFDLPIPAFCAPLRGHLIFASANEKLNRAENTVAACIAKFCEKQAKLNEINIAHSIPGLLAPGWALFLGNSMPVRDVDMFGCVGDVEIPVAANRGASGIDGNLATACGFAAGLQQPVAVLLGDLAALHDLNSLKLVADSAEQLIIILVNNHGGGIFNFLPVAGATPHFEKYFNTPHDLDFQKAAEMFSLEYACPQNAAEFATEFKRITTSGNSGLIEIFTDREENFKLHQAFQLEIRKKLRKIFAT